MFTEEGGTDIKCKFVACKMPYEKSVFLNIKHYKKRQWKTEEDAALVRNLQVMYPGYKFEFGPRGNGICYKMSRNLSENGRIQKYEH